MAEDKNGSSGRTAVLVALISALSALAAALINLYGSKKNEAVEKPISVAVRPSSQPSVPSKTESVPEVRSSTPTTPREESPVVAPPELPVRVMAGEMSNYLISQPMPVLPPIARAAHVKGAVVLHVLISKTGSVKSLDVITGPEMLRSSALDNVRSWRYKPYYLNGEPREVETTVTVNFTLPNY